MSEKLCRRIDDETRVNARERCKKFDNECPECLCERFSFGDGSPGTVTPEEVLVRFHYSPIDIGDDGKPTTFAFSDVDSLGLSVTRDGATDQEMQEAIANRLRSLLEGTEWHSVSLANVSDVRQLVRQLKDRPEERAFCVYDTAEQHNRMHAEVCQTKAGRSQRKYLRDKFVNMSRDLYRNGGLNPRR